MKTNYRVIRASRSVTAAPPDDLWCPSLVDADKFNARRRNKIIKMAKSEHTFLLKDLRFDLDSLELKR